MIGIVEERTINEANYIIKHNATVRKTARKFQVSKSSVHKDVTERLPKLNPVLHKQVRRVLDKNINERAARGGQATKRKYKSDLREKVNQ